MRRPTTEEQAGLRALLARAHKPGDTLELLGEAWIDDVLQTAGDDDLVEVLIDVDAKDREQRWCSAGCFGADCYGYCSFYDLFDAPPGSPDDLEVSGPAAPQLCPLRQPGRAVLVRRAP